MHMQPSAKPEQAGTTPTQPRLCTGDDIAWNMFLHMRGAKPPIGLAGVRMDDIYTWDGR